jgi:hypothetical protein
MLQEDIIEIFAFCETAHEHQEDHLLLIRFIVVGHAVCSNCGFHQ